MPQPRALKPDELAEIADYFFIHLCESLIHHGIKTPQGIKDAMLLMFEEWLQHRDFFLASMNSSLH